MAMSARLCLPDPSPRTAPAVHGRARTLSQNFGLRRGEEERLRRDGKPPRPFKIGRGADQSPASR